MFKKEKLSPLKLSITLQTLIAMVLGIVVGAFFGKNLLFLGEVSRLLVNAIKFLAMPLLFLTITDGFLRSEFKGRGFIALLFVSGFNAVCAVSIALMISNFFKPGRWLSLQLPADSVFSSDGLWLKNLNAMLPNQGIGSLLTGTTLVIFISLLTGSSLLLLRNTFLKHRQDWFTKLTCLMDWGLHQLFFLVDVIVLFLPLAVFCAVVKAIGAQGLTIAKGLLAYFLACSSGMAFHILLIYQTWIRQFGKIDLRFFWRSVLDPALYAFGINSSLATLPVTLKALDRLKVSPASARLSACVGTNFNNDGILLYEVVAALFLMQAYGISLPLKSQLFVAVISIVACIGVAGIPEAGIISLTIVLSCTGLPTEAITFLLAIDWVLARMRSFTNVLGDITVAVVIDRLTSMGRFSENPKLLK
ncbi:MAG: dicarboxylate/amino acid:cation symporter [Proteobacteria bacterium]|nr:dicarboxylate/amino acid:cation symporter [Pseudomonadota bacterium]NDC23668.1 dicarboxylate/amino acid:cation symporter [Pseudomonadota bacterium]